VYSILILDDEKNIRLTIKKCLDNPGYEVDEAYNGEEALVKFTEKTYHLLLLDLKLPGMDGMELLKLVKDQYPQMAVIIISAHGSIATAVEAMKLGALDYLEKPFTPAEIRSVVQKALPQ